MSENGEVVFGLWLRSEREKRGWTIREAASRFANPWKTGVLEVTWESWELGKHKLPGSKCQALARTLGIPMEEWPTFVHGELSKEEVHKVSYWGGQRENLRSMLKFRRHSLRTLVQEYKVKHNKKVSGQRMYQVLQELDLLEAFWVSGKLLAGTKLTKYHRENIRRCPCGEILPDERKENRCKKCACDHQLRWKEQNPERARVIRMRTRQKNSLLLTCSNPKCGKDFKSSRAASGVEWARRTGQQNFYCSRACSTSHKHQLGIFGSKKAESGLLPQT